MEQKINIAELLKDCPKGMELDCTMIDNVVFEKLDVRSPHHPIIIIRRTDSKNSNTTIHLTKYGQYSDEEDYKCVIYPKGKTTWEGFVPPCKFKDGYIVVTKTSNNFIFYSIYKDVKNRKVLTYVDYNIDSNRLMFNDDTLSSLCFIDEIVEQRLATEDEKKKLFDAIKANGYKWNAETKTLEKLVEPRFKVGNTIQDENGYKVKITEVNIEDECYGYESIVAKGIGGIAFSDQGNWELVPNKFDITTLNPFDKVLVRVCDTAKWIGDFYMWYDDTEKDFPYNCVGGIWSYCIPYEFNEHLLGTTDDCDEFYKTWE